MGARGVSELLGSGEHRKPATCRAIGGKDAAASCRGARFSSTLAMYHGTMTVCPPLLITSGIIIVCPSPFSDICYHNGVPVPS